MKGNYLFSSPRLGFRNWSPDDLPGLAALNADPAVMRHFPNTLTLDESAALLTRFQDHYTNHGHTYFAVDLLATGAFLGFIGLCYQDYPSPFTPATDIGWRLNQNAWGQGYATEGARRCLEFGFREVGLERIIAVCTEHNAPSERVMQKIGMEQMGSFLHPKLQAYPTLEKCLCYGLEKSAWEQWLA